MQPKINYKEVVEFNENAPTVARESFEIGNQLVTVEIFIDYYDTRNARLLIDGKYYSQWNGGREGEEWNLTHWIAPRSWDGSRKWHPTRLKKFPYPKGLAQYKFRKKVGQLAQDLWQAENYPVCSICGVRVKRTPFASEVKSRCVRRTCQDCCKTHHTHPYPRTTRSWERAHEGDPTSDD